MRLITLEGLRLEPDGFRRPKLLLLVAYLALERSRPRDHLRALFWPQATDASASLRVALAQFRQDAPGVIEESASTLSTRIPCDALELLEALDTGSLTRAVSLYTGAFLDGVPLADYGPELEEWVLVTREFIAGRVTEAHAQLAERALEDGDADAVKHHVAQARQVPGASPLEPEMLSRLHGLLSAIASPLAAELRREAAELGFDPTEEPRPVTSSAGPAPTNLPAPLNAFVSRVPEMRYLTDTLLQPEVRLVTVTGPGGVGKSRLALETARTLHRERRFADGVFIAFLEPLESVDACVSELLRVLGVQPEPGADPQVRLAERLRDDELLLVLDNFEHLIQFADQLERLLGACPKLKVLVTSRERLGLLAEWLLPLEGLSATDADANPAAPQHAIELFARRAKRVDPGFSLMENQQAVLEICQQVYGLPLAIELAAALVRTMPLPELAEALSQHPDVLEGAIRDPQERHHGIRAVFEHSWKLLKPLERRTLARMTVFRDGATFEAISYVTETNLYTLVSLINKSLIQLRGSKRYYIHSLLGEYCAEKLYSNLNEVEIANLRYGEFFLQLFSDSLNLMRGIHSRQGISIIEAELENIKSAWIGALDKFRFDEFDILDPVIYFDQVGRLQEGLDLFSRTTHIFEMNSLIYHSEKTRFACMLLMNSAWLLFRLGNFSEAKRKVEEFLHLINYIKGKDYNMLAKAYNVLSNINKEINEIDMAIFYGKRAAQISHARNDGRTKTISLVNLANAFSAAGEIEKAMKTFKIALNMQNLKDQFYSMSMIELNMAELMLNYGKNDEISEAKEMLDRGLSIVMKEKIVRLQPYFYVQFSVYYSMTSNRGLACEYAKDALELAWTIRDQKAEVESVFRIAEILSLDNKNETALKLLQYGLQKSWNFKKESLLLYGLFRYLIAKLNLNDLDLAKNILPILRRHYPKKHWIALELNKIQEKYNLAFEELSGKDEIENLLQSILNSFPIGEISRDYIQGELLRINSTPLDLEGK